MSTHPPPGTDEPDGSAGSLLRADTEQIQGTATVVLSGEIDVSVSDGVRSSIDDAVVLPDVARLIIDMTGVTFMDSTGIGVLIGTANKCEDAGIALRVEPSPIVRRVLHIAGLDVVLLPDDDIAPGVL